MRTFIILLLFTFSLNKNYESLDKYIYITNKEYSEKSNQKKDIYTGIDISKYQSVDWDNLDLDTVDFIICKKSEGVTLEDSKFKEHIRKITCLKGIYHFFRPQYSGIEQAKFFLKDIDSLKIDIKPVIDVEWSKWWSSQNTKIGISRLNEMIDYIEMEIGCKPIIYTSPKFWNKYINNNIDLNGVNLWVADWRGDSIPELPVGFNNWYIWQQTPNKKIDGVSGFVDWNIAKSIDSLLINN